jgi:hypothetical protein
MCYSYPCSYSEYLFFEIFSEIPVIALNAIAASKYFCYYINLCPF